MTDEQQALMDLVTHAGWRLFVAEAKKRWGAEGYGRQLKTAVAGAIKAQQSAEAAIGAVDRANDEINALLTWPMLRLKHLEEQVAREQGEPLISRRGPHL